MSDFSIAKKSICTDVLTISQRLAISRRLKDATFIERENLSLLPSAKIAPIQSVGYMRLLGRLSDMLTTLGGDAV